MKLRHFVATLTCCVLTAACTTPPPRYNVSGKAAANEKDAAALMMESANASLAERFSKASSPPRLINSVAPEISNAAANHGGMGTVRVQVSVAKDGRVTEVKVLESPNQYLSEDVSRALMQWIFSPLVVDGEAKEFKFFHPFHFRLRA